MMKSEQQNFSPSLLLCCTWCTIYISPGYVIYNHNTVILCMRGDHTPIRPTNCNVFVAVVVANRKWNQIDINILILDSLLHSIYQWVSVSFPCSRWLSVSLRKRA